MIDQTDQQAAPVRGRRLGRSPKLIASSLVVFLAVVLGGFRWLTTPNALSDKGNGSAHQVEVGQPTVTTLVALPNAPATVRSVSPHAMTGAKTRVSFHGCAWKPEGVGLFDGSVSQFCGELRPANGFVIGRTPNPERWFLVAEITLLEPGAVRIEGFDIAYSQGIRRRSQVSGWRIQLYTQGHRPLP